MLVWKFYKYTNVILENLLVTNFQVRESCLPRKFRSQTLTTDDKCKHDITISATKNIIISGTKQL